MSKNPSHQTASGDTLEESCGTCKYFARKNGFYDRPGPFGLYRRFPSQPEKTHEDWCGEWKEQS